MTDPGIVDIYDALLLDLDGVVYRGKDAVPHAVTSLVSAVAHGVRAAYVTNNAARPPAEVASHLRELGLTVDLHDVVTSAQAGAREVASRVASGSVVLAVGGPGVAEALLARGLTVVTSALEQPVAVMMGYGPDVSWRDLAEAGYAIENGAIFVATNTDATIPTAQGIAPGNGTLVNAVVTATGVAPLVAGKPCTPLMRESIERVGANRPLVVGDRLDTDIEGAQAAGLDSLLVFTGVTRVVDLLAAPPHQRPTYVAADLRGLAAPSDTLRVASTSGGRPRRDGLSDLRDACLDAWTAADAGLRPRGVDLAALERDVVKALARL